MSNSRWARRWLRQRLARVVFGLAFATGVASCAVEHDEVEDERALESEALELASPCANARKPPSLVCMNIFCNATDRMWEYSPKAQGTACGTNLACDGHGECVPPPPPPPPPRPPIPRGPCSDIPKPRELVCNRLFCNTSDHVWEYIPLTNGTSCESAGQCAGGECVVPEPQPPAPTDEVSIHAETSPEVFIAALAAGNKKVVLDADVDLDLTGFASIPIEGNTMITSAGPRGPLWEGPVVRTRSRPKVLLEVVGNNVRIEGFRLYGADFARADHECTGIKVVRGKHVEISNMEVAGFASVGIDVRDPDRRLPMFEYVRIHHNYIHHNAQSLGGGGYGVGMHDNAKATIDHNVFDANRHAIAADGDPSTGYIADHNLVLMGGGRHFNETTGGLLSWYTHQFDVHGSQHMWFNGLAWDCVSDPWLIDVRSFDCGRAGDTFHVRNNAFQYNNGVAFKLRGTPVGAAFVDNNVFAHQSLGDAVVQNEVDLVLGSGAKANRTGQQTFGRYGVCDFDGDGLDDLFLASGTSFWYSSAGRGRWTFLQDATERLDQVLLGEFDGDGRCDVLAGRPLQIASGGAAAFAPLPGANDFSLSELRVGHFYGEARNDLFRRAPSGEWFASMPGVRPWQLLGSSVVPIESLRFGFFDGDRVTDIVAVRSGQWSISKGGRESWEPLGPLSTALDKLLVGDVDGNGIDDVLRYSLDVAADNDGDGVRDFQGSWQISVDGRTPWQGLYDYPKGRVGQSYLLPNPVPGFIGRFANPGASALLTVGRADSDQRGEDEHRMGYLFDFSARAFGTHSRHAL